LMQATERRLIINDQIFVCHRNLPQLNAGQLWV